MSEILQTLVFSIVCHIFCHPLTAKEEITLFTLSEIGTKNLIFGVKNIIKKYSDSIIKQNTR